MKKPKVVVLGAGYGGLMTVTRLQKVLHQDEADIVLINKNDYHYETTWLHEVSGGNLHQDRVRYSIAGVINESKVKFIQDSVIHINKEDKKVMLEHGEISYDYLVVGLGSVPETFGIKGLADYAFTISNLNAARMICEHIERQFATYHTEEKEDGWLTVVVGGAGFTGIEFLGELTNRIPHLCKKYHIDFEKVRIYCVEASKSILPVFDHDLIDYALSFLKKRGVEFKLGTVIEGVTEKGIIVSKGGKEVEEIKASTVVWAAGVRGNSIIESSGFEMMSGRAKVNRDMRALGFEDIFIVGDCVFMLDEETNHPYPASAHVAIQQGELIAKNLVKLIRNQLDLETFVFDNKGLVCSLGHNDAIGIIFGKKVMGKKAVLMKKLIANRSLLLMGGPSLVAKKGKFNII